MRTDLGWSLDPPRAVLVRVSAQRYTESADIERLVAALGRRLNAE